MENYRINIPVFQQIIIREKNKAKKKPINQKKEETHQPNMIHGL